MDNENKDNYFSERYEEIKDSKAINELSDWKLNNHNTPFNQDNYSKNAELYLNDISKILDELEVKSKVS
jgi:hypothetical protein